MFSMAYLKSYLTRDWYTGCEEAETFLANLYQNRGDLSIKQLSYNVFGCMVASVSNYAQAATQVIDFYLDDARAAEKGIICELAQQEVHIYCIPRVTKIWADSRIL